MQVLLLRHAEAVAETLELRDPSRHLTPLGRRQARALGDRLRWHDCTPTQIWTSPLARAIQTAELVVAGMQIDVSVEVMPELAPDGDAHAIVAAVQAIPADGSVMLVGHEPLLSAIGALIVGDPGFSGLGKAQAVRIVDGRPRWRFAWDAEAPQPIIDGA